MATQARILVVEDMSDWCEKLAGILRREGYLVREAADYDEAIRWLESQIFDLAVIDIRLEDWDATNIQGMVLIDEIRRRKIEKDMGIIIVTGYGTAEHARKAFRDHHVFDFLAKANFDLEEFKMLVAEAIEDAYAKRGDILEKKW